MLPLLGGGWGGDPLELCSIEPLLWEKDHCLGKGPGTCLCPAVGWPWLPGCSPRLAGEEAAPGGCALGAGEGTAEASVWSRLPRAFHLPQSSRASLMCYIFA